MSSITQSAITDGINGLIDSGKGILGTPIAAALGGAVLGGAVAGTLGYIAGSSTSTHSTSSRKKRKKITHTKRGLKQDRKRRSKQKWEVAYQKRKRKAKRSKYHTRRRGVHYTKNGQPYVILSSGKSRFIKKKNKRG